MNSPDDARIDRRAVRRAFARAAASYDAAAVLQREVAARMRARLDYVAIEPSRVVDAGCGTGASIAALAARFPAASVVGVDLALPMLERAAAALAPRSLLDRLRVRSRRRAWVACADIERMPFAAASVGLVWSNLVLQWLDDPAVALAEFARVLETGGLASFTTFGPDTLREVRAAFGEDPPRVSRFVDMHDLGDALVATGFVDPVMDMERITLTYATPRELLLDLKHIGATNALRSRTHGLTGRNVLARAEAALEASRVGGRIPVTFEVIYGHAWRGVPRRARDGRAIVRFDPGTRP